MKTIILVASIFYILGLKLGHKIDIVKKSNPVEKIITNCITPPKTPKTVHFNQQEVEKAEPDSLNSEAKKNEESIFNNK